ncbi:DUF4255 domain-containing protein [Neolewinella lacunae]|uniref:DUF4255 domain-containing protein n=1 Tax=Neolewinella lacunae TaxID=1517758 RepID=A0A923PSF6_9BACT|nr:DUF4255 domain-containing protein [Neolewinella lacunae]MBC6996649.1 DUF4255 domain-containing protein [Neolewinella lacunae]MDN3634786.1 DUF4255 domain-containing protein [Neolewinella lacunae]
MIQQVLTSIVGDLNGYLRRTVADAEDKAVLGALAEADGSPAATGDNRMVCTLVNIEQERVNLNQLPDRSAKTNAPVCLNLYLLFSARFPNNYAEALKFLALTIGFFQGKQVFTPQNTPGLPAGAEKVTMEIYNLDLHAQSQLWGALGAKLVPAVVMKMRMLTITRNLLLEEISEIRAVESNSQVDPNRTTP